MQGDNTYRGWVDNGQKAWGNTRDECIAAIDDWFEGHNDG